MSYTPKFPSISYHNLIECRMFHKSSKFVILYLLNLKAHNALKIILLLVQALRLQNIQGCLPRMLRKLGHGNQRFACQ